MELEKVVSEDGELTYKCSCCNKEYKDLPFCIGFEFPDYYFSIPEEERESRVHYTKDLCVIDDEYYFIRGRIEIPIIDNPDSFAFDVWASLSEKSFLRVQELWDDPERVNESPYFGWLDSEIPTYDFPEGVQTNVHTSTLGFIPEIEITDEVHQLAFDQQNGISIERAFEFLEAVMPGFHK